MKRTLALLAFLLLFSVFGAAQGASYFNCTMTAANTYCPSASGSTVLNAGIDTQNLYAVVQGSAGTLTLLIQGSEDGLFDDAVTCGTVTIATATAPTGPSLSCTGVYTRVRVKLSVLTTFTGVNVTYVGVSTAAKTQIGRAHV